MPTLAEANAILANGDLLFSAAEVAAATSRVATELNRDYRDKYPLILSVMGGAVVFTGHLLSQLDFPLDFDIVQASRYGNAKVILDEGVTLAAIVDLVKKQGAISVTCAVFCVKDYGAEINAKKPLVADYIGITVPNRFVFGYGMDVSGAWRNLPAIYAVNGK
jgi:hypoxanthine phosphoribosyltransferase